MIPLYLKFQAFASYIEPAEIDFKKLDRLFLIHGETGAGKTAILDAITYSLYGETSGGERTNVRCADVKAESLPTETEFIFEVKGRHYKFTRTIRLTKSKKEDARQDCFYLTENNEWIPFFDNPKQTLVKAKAEELLGLTCEQFRQVIILPQGKFEKLLTSDSADKEKILSTLFNADKYTRLSNQLYFSADTERKRLQSKKAILDNTLAVNNADSFDTLVQIFNDKGEALKVTTAKKTENQKTLDTLNEKYTSHQVIIDRFNQLEKAKNELTTLENQSEEYKKIKQTLNRCDNALKVSPEHKSYQNALSLQKERKSTFDAELKNKEALTNELDNATKKEYELKENEENNKLKQAEIIRLESLVECYTQAKPAQKQYEENKQNLLQYQNNKNDILSKKDNITSEITRLSDNKQNILINYTSKLEPLKARLDELDKGKTAYEKYTQYSDLLKSLVSKNDENIKKLEQYNKNVSDAEHNYDKIFSEYLNSLSATISQTLSEGVPCPVCGSIHHPHPAIKENSVSQEDVEACKDKVTNIKKNRDEIADNVKTLNERIKNGNERINEQKQILSDTKYTSEEYKKVLEDYNVCYAKNKEYFECEKLLQQLSQDKNNIEKQLEEATLKCNDFKVKTDTALYTLNMYKEKFDKNISDITHLNKKIVALKSETEQYERMTKQIVEEKNKCRENYIEASAKCTLAEKELLKADENTKKQYDSFIVAIQKNGFSDENDYTNSILADSLYKEYTDKFDNYILEKQTIKSNYAELTKQLDGIIKPDNESIKAQIAEAEKVKVELVQNEAVLSDNISQLKKVISTYKKEFEKYTSDKEKNDKQILFANMMRGDKGISFTRYVLGVMLSLITEQANRLLLDVHGGQFRLKRKMTGDLRSKQGLELEVESALSSQAMQYSVKGLSGGEKFIISLALSMGLSTTIQSLSGGISIDAMFIDEGFGSLDPRTLKEAVTVLCGLKGNRGTVGIISHVKELTDIIPQCIEITKDKNGSKIKY